MRNLKRVFGAAVLGTLLAGPALAQEPRPKPADNTVEPDQALANLVCDVAKEKKYILLGDTDHTDRTVQGVKFSDALLKAIRNCTESHVYVQEGPPDSESFLRRHGLDLLANFETYIKGGYEIKNSDLLKDDLNFLKAAAYGIEQRFYDTGYERIDSSARQTEVFDILTSVYQYGPKCVNIALLHTVKAKARDPREFWSELEEVINARLADDNQPIADSVLKNHPKGAVLFYGDGHMEGTHDLNEMLGKENTAWIKVIGSSNPAEYTDGGITMTKLYNASGGSEQPDYIYDANKQIILTNEQEKKLGPHQFRALTADEFNACTIALADDIKRALPFSYEDYRMLMDPNKGLPPALESWARPALSSK